MCTANHRPAFWLYDSDLLADPKYRRYVAICPSDNSGPLKYAPGNYWLFLNEPGGTYGIENVAVHRQRQAQLTRAGQHTLQVSCPDPAVGLSVVIQVLTSVSVTPAGATVAVDATTQFTATAPDQFGDAALTS